jgi:hypothetical protein
MTFVFLCSISYKTVREYMRKKKNWKKEEKKRKISLPLLRTINRSAH